MTDLTAWAVSIFNWMEIFNAGIADALRNIVNRPENS